MKSLNFLKKGSKIWFLFTIFILILLLIPNINIIINSFAEAGENWEHVKKYLIFEYFNNTLILLISVGFLSAIIGSSLAWLITAYDFPGRNFLSWGLILPLAIPPYIGSYVYVGMFNYTGTIQVFFRNKLGLDISNYIFDFMTLKGAVFIYTIFLFPYVYLLTKSFLSKQTASLLESSRLLGKTDSKIFTKIVLPLSRGAIVAGTSLVMMEVLNDYGVVKYFGISTFTTAIFKTWFGMGDLITSVRLALSSMAIIFLILFIEKLLRGGRRYNYSTSDVRSVNRRKLEGLNKILAMIFSYSIFSIGFLLPVIQLLYWNVLSRGGPLKETLYYTFTSFLTSGGASAIILIGAIIIAGTVRMSSNIIGNIIGRITILGYSIPGAVVAIGVLLFILQLDSFIVLMETLIGIKIDLVLSNTIIVLIFAYTVRFMGISFNSVNSGYEKIGESYFEAARTLGKNATSAFFKIDLPMLKPALLSGYLLVFIEVMKELPLTLILRPFNFDTLATKAFEYASDEMIYRAADFSIVLILFLAIAIYFITHQKRGENNATSNK